MTESSAPQAKASGNTLSIIGIVCGVVAVIFFPIVFGPAGIVLGVIGRAKGERLGTVAIVVGVLGLILGFVLSAVAFNATN